MIRIKCKGFDLSMDFDPSDELDCEILMEAYALLLRRSKTGEDGVIEKACESQRQQIEESEYWPSQGRKMVGDE